MSMLFYYKKKVVEDILKANTDILKEISEDKSDIMKLQDYLDQKRRSPYYYAENVIMDFWIYFDYKDSKEYKDARRHIRLAGLDPIKYSDMLQKYKL